MRRRDSGAARFASIRQLCSAPNASDGGCHSLPRDSATRHARPDITPPEAFMRRPESRRAAGSLCTAVHNASGSLRVPPGIQAVPLPAILFAQGKRSINGPSCWARYGEPESTETAKPARPHQLLIRQPVERAGLASQIGSLWRITALPSTTTPTFTPTPTANTSRARWASACVLASSHLVKRRQGRRSYHLPPPSST